jgi:hypothetical protein
MVLPTKMGGRVGGGGVKRTREWKKGTVYREDRKEEVERRDRIEKQK